MFDNLKDFKGNFTKEDDAKKYCESCGSEDFDLLTTEKVDNGDSVSAIFICKNCGIQKNVNYSGFKIN